MIVVESRFYPFMMISFRGEGFTEAEYRTMLDATREVGRQAQDAGTRHVSITYGGANMNAAERRMMAGLMETFPKDLLDLVIGSYVVVSNPAIRGILTALRWLSPALAMIEPVATIEAAMAASAAAFAAHDIAVDEEVVKGARRWLKSEAVRLPLSITT